MQRAAIADGNEAVREAVKDPRDYAGFARAAFACAEDLDPSACLMTLFAERNCSTPPSRSPPPFDRGFPTAGLRARRLFYC